MALIRRAGGAEPSSTGVFEAERATLDSRGVAAESSSPVSSLSSPNESLLFATGFFFFFFGGPSARGVAVLLFHSTLCYQRQFRCIDKEKNCVFLTHPSVTSPVDGVALLELPVANLPSDLSCASRSFCSRTSARRLRKSDKWTRPTVCDLSRSSADAV